jgi:hypothetical protein
MEFVTDNLTHKWGFHDGEQLEPLLCEAGYPVTRYQECPICNLSGELCDECVKWQDFTQLVLCECIERFVCTQIKNSIRPYRMVTSHNPIRVYEIDGVHLSDIPERELSLAIEPHTIQVADSELLSTAAEIHADLQRYLDKEGKVDILCASEIALQIRKQFGWDTAG